MIGQFNFAPSSELSIPQLADSLTEDISLQPSKVQIFLLISRRICEENVLYNNFKENKESKSKFLEFVNASNTF